MLCLGSPNLYAIPRRAILWCFVIVSTTMLTPMPALCIVSIPQNIHQTCIVNNSRLNDTIMFRWQRHTPFTNDFHYTGSIPGNIVQSHVTLVLSHSSGRSPDMPATRSFTRVTLATVYVTEVQSCQSCGGGRGGGGGEGEGEGWQIRQ